MQWTYQLVFWCAEAIWNPSWHGAHTIYSLFVDIEHHESDSYGPWYYHSTRHCSSAEVSYKRTRFAGNHWRRKEKDTQQDKFRIHHTSLHVVSRVRLLLRSFLSDSLMSHRQLCLGCDVKSIAVTFVSQHSETILHCSLKASLDYFQNIFTAKHVDLV